MSDPDRRSLIEDPPGEDEPSIEFTPVGFDATPSSIGNEWFRSGQLFGAVTLASHSTTSAEVVEEAARIGIPAMRTIGAEETRDLAAMQAIASDYHRTGVSPEFDDYATRALWTDLKSSGDPELAFGLAAALLTSRNELIRVAAACALSPFTVDTTRQLENVMLESVYSPNLSISGMANIGLHNLAAEAPAQSQATRGESDLPESIRTTENTTSIAVHGTFARLATDKSWFVPNTTHPNLHGYLKVHASENLYADSDWYFRWDSGYSEYSRRNAADHLEHWMREFRFSELDTVYAHSHGGNVVLNALATGTKVKRLVLLHVPPLRRSSEEWQSIRQNVGKVIVMRSRLDCVMLGDTVRHGRFPNLDFDQLLLPHHPIYPHPLRSREWIKHSLFTNLETWEKYRLDREIKYEQRFTR